MYVVIRGPVDEVGAVFQTEIAVGGPVEIDAGILHRGVQHRALRAGVESRGQKQRQEKNSEQVHATN